MNWQNAYYRMIDQHDKLVLHIEKLESHLEKEKKLPEDGEVDLV